MGQVHKVSLYADDLLLFISNPEISVPKCSDTILQFGVASGYKINLTKSVLFPINKKALTMSFNQCAFRVITGPLTYLGIKVTRCYIEQHKQNFQQLWIRLKRISTAGQISHCLWPVALIQSRWLFYTNFYTYFKPFPSFFANHTLKI